MPQTLYGGDCIETGVKKFRAGAISDGRPYRVSYRVALQL
jgi:hypothetical protein